MIYLEPSHTKLRIFFFYLVRLPVPKEVDRAILASLNDSPSTRVVSLVTPNLHKLVAVVWFQEIHAARGVSALQSLETVFERACKRDWMLTKNAVYCILTNKGFHDRHSFSPTFEYHSITLTTCTSNRQSNQMVKHMDRELLEKWSHCWPWVTCAKYDKCFLVSLMLTANRSNHSWHYMETQRQVL